jgi:hypothetical protein
MVGNSLSFLTVHQTALVGQRFKSHDCWKLDRSAEMEILADYTFRYKSGFWQNLVMTFPEIPNAKNVVNKLSFSLVTHMGYSDARFGSYGIFEVRTRY